MAGAVASTSEAVWVLSGGFLSVPRVFRVDPAKEQATEVVTTGDGPAAIAAGFGDLWVADHFENTVSRIEPSGAVAETIPVLRGASAVAVGEGAVWVAASLDDKVVRIDPQTNSVDDGDRRRPLPGRHRRRRGRRVGRESGRRHRLPHRPGSPTRSSSESKSGHVPRGSPSRPDRSG